MPFEFSAFQVKMMNRTACSAVARVAGARAISGVAPVLNLGVQQSKLSNDAQTRKNTNIALEMIKKFKGEAAKPYTRRYTQSFAQVESEIEALLGGAEKMRRKVTDDQPMDKLSIMERCLRHGVWQYLKDDGKADFAEMEKWIVYTSNDETNFNLLKRSAQVKANYAAFQAKKADAGNAGAAVVPMFDWSKEYAQTIDRELVAEKRYRYDVVAANTTARHEAEVDALVQQFRQPKQDARLDSLIDLLERFKPVLAREAIMQRLTIKHLEGQLGVWRYMDWNPEVRDRAELESDNYCQQWWSEFEEKRMLAVRLRSKNEVKEVMEKTQATIAAASATPAAAAGGKGKNANDAARAKLLAEVIRLQQRVKSKDDQQTA
jgi:hypothetical protein